MQRIPASDNFTHRGGVHGGRLILLLVVGAMVLGAGCAAPEESAPAPVADLVEGRDYLPVVGDILHFIQSPDGKWMAVAVFMESETSELRLTGPNGASYVAPLATPLSFTPKSDLLVFSAAEPTLVSAIYLLPLSLPFSPQRISNLGVKDEPGFLKSPAYIPVPASSNGITWSNRKMRYTVEGTMYLVDVDKKEVRRATQ